MTLKSNFASSEQELLIIRASADREQGLFNKSPGQEVDIIGTAIIRGIIKQLQDINGIDKVRTFAMLLLPLLEDRELYIALLNSQSGAMGGGRGDEQEVLTVEGQHNCSS